MRWRELIDSWIFYHVLGVRVRPYVGRTLLAEMKQICSSQTQCYLRLHTSDEDLWLSCKRHWEIDFTSLLKIELKHIDKTSLYRIIRMCS